MKKLLLSMTISMLASLAIAQRSKHENTAFIEGQGIISKNSFEPNFKGEIEDFKKGKIVGWNIFTQISEHWYEGLFGLSIRPKVKGFQKFNLNFSAGFEAAGPPPLRLRSSLYFESLFYENFSAIEYGGSGLWYFEVFQFDISQHIKLGLQAERFAGVGPRIEIFRERATQRTEGTLSFWLTPSYDFEENLPKINFGITSSMF